MQVVVIDANGNDVTDSTALTWNVGSACEYLACRNETDLVDTSATPNIFFSEPGEAAIVLAVAGDWKACVVEVYELEE